MAEPEHRSDQWVTRSLQDLPRLMDVLGAGRALLVVDRAAARGAGVEGVIRVLLGARLVAEFDGFVPNPDSSFPLAAARMAHEHGAAVMVALGGGSCMDVAKVGGLAAGAIDRAEAIVRGGPASDVRPLPVVAVPTTSGTGSEATHFSAIYVDGRKVSVAHPGIRPVGVVLDVDMHMTMPRGVASATGLDALCQATESLWAMGASERSRAHASGAQSSIVGHLAASVNTGDRASRERMMLGAHEAGQAINISKTTAAHALSYELTTRCGIPHGVAVALTLGHVAAFNADVNAQTVQPGGDAEMVRASIADACRLIGGSPTLAPAFMRGLLRECGQPATLREAGVREDALEPMASAADVVRLANNPRRMTAADALEVLRAAY